MTTIEDVLKALDLERYASIFADNEVDLRALLVLTDSDLKELRDHEKRGLPLGPRKLLLNEIEKLKAQSDRGAAGERRQITLLFCDVVGSTALSSEVRDPEILETIIRSYHDACEAVIARFEGRVFERHGEEVVAFFGYPYAHEDDSRRAIHAGLEIIESVRTLTLPHDRVLKVRVTITSGLVVVDADGKRAVGEVETMNLAARLKEITPEGTVVVSERVRQLAGGAFQYEDLGEQHLRGISRPIRAHRVCGLRSAATRFDAATQNGLTPLIGRKREIKALLDRWKLASGGDGQVVLVSGEPGIGKSRILNELRHRVERSARIMTLQCSPYYVDSAFYPSIGHLERTLKIDRETPTTTKLERLEALMSERRRPRDDVELIAWLLAVPYSDRPRRQEITPQRHKELTIRALVDLVEAGARQRPTLMLFEDVHWADPSSLELLDVLIGRMQNFPLLLVVSHRPEFSSPWLVHRHAAALHIAKLTRSQSLTMVAKLTGTQGLPVPLLEQIIVKTAGVPLWVEEVTKSVLENLEQVDDKGELAEVAIPRTLHGSLQERLDRVRASVKEVAQIGSVIGREFSYELIAAVTAMSRSTLDDALARLTQSGLAIRRRSDASAVYVFKHALVRDVAYDSLYKARRQQLHGRIAQALEQRFPSTAANEPELLARHYHEAGVNERAVAFWQRAGELSKKRFALSEAITHLQRGLDLVKKLGESRERDVTELALRTQLAPVLVAVHGWAATEVSDVLEPAWRLASQLGHAESYLPILHGLWVHHLTKNNLDAALRWAEEMLAASRSGEDPDLEISARRSLMASYFWLGELQTARRHADEITSQYDVHRHAHIVDRTNNDPMTMVGIYASHFLWMLGYPAQAMRECDAKDEHARRGNHPFDLGFALTLGSHAFDYCRLPERLLPRAEEAERVGRERGVSLMSEIMAQIIKGIAWLRAGRTVDSIGQLYGAIKRLEKTGHRIYVTYCRAVLAEAMAREGDCDAAMSLVDESLHAIEERGQYGERVHYAEILRLKGWMLHSRGNLDAAADCLLNALEVAERQQARSWQLRVLVTLFRLRSAQGRPTDVRDRLQHTLDSFTEGHDTADLEEARSLLAALRGATPTRLLEDRG